MATVQENAVDYSVVSGMVIQTGENGHTEVWLGFDVGKAYPASDMHTIMVAVQEKIESGRKPAGYLSKALHRIGHHREQLHAALTSLLDTHAGMTAVAGSKRPTATAAWKARYAMLQGMSNKVLKMYAADFLPDEVDNYILSDDGDRIALITKLTSILCEDKEEKEDSTALIEE